MSFNTSSLAAYVINGKGYALKAVADAPTAKLLFASKNAQFGVKGKEAIKKISNTTSLLDGANCSRTGGSNTTLDQGYITVVPIKTEDNLCTKDLWNTFFSDALIKGQAPEESFTPEFVNTIMTDKAANIAAANEILIWQGDTSLSAGNNKRTDGIIKQLTGTSYTTSATSATSVTTSGDMVAKLQTVYTSSTISVRSQDDYYIFVGKDTFDSYAITLAGKNIYKPVEDKTLFGTTAKIFVTQGLNGLNRVVAGRLSDLAIGTDGTGDADNAIIKYSDETNLTYMDFHYALGVAVIWPQQFVFATV